MFKIQSRKNKAYKTLDTRPTWGQALADLRRKLGDRAVDQDGTVWTVDAAGNAHKKGAR